MQIKQGLKRKFEDLKGSLKALERVVVAYSGGVDSTFLLKVCVDVLGAGNVIAFVGTSPTYPASEVEEAKRHADLIGVSCVLSETFEMEDQDFLLNRTDRCYHCKSHLFKRAWDIAKTGRYSYVLEGSNHDDLKDFRPGRRACAEQKVKSPLLEAGLTKKEIRELSKLLLLPTHDKPSFACFSSRIPYGTPINVEILNRIELSETFIRSLGASQVRVRCHNDIARIEVDEKELTRLLKHRGQIVNELKKYGFAYVALDLQGYRTGSMNEPMQHKGLLQE